MLKPSSQEFAPIGGRRDVTRGFVHGLLLPQDRVLEEQGRGDLDRAYAQVEQDDQVFACLSRRISAVVSRERTCDPGGDRPIDIEAAEHLKRQVDRWWDRAVEKHLRTARLYGRSFAELMYAVEGVRYVAESVRVRNVRRFRFGSQSEPRLLTLDNWQGEELPPQKFWGFACGGEHDDDPYGRGLAYYLYWPTFFKREGWRFWGKFLERFARPTATGTYPAGATEEELADFLKITESVWDGTSAVMPPGFELELIESARSGADYGEMCDRMDKAISKIILGHSAGADATPGRLGGEDEASGAALHLTKQDADLLCASFNRGPARWLTDWNFPGAAYPEVWVQFSESENLTDRANRDKILFDMGYPLTAEAVQEIYGSHYRLPDAKQEAEIVSLNGAQVQSLIEVIARVAAGEIPVEAGVQLISVAFPAISIERAREMLGPVVAKEEAAAEASAAVIPPEPVAAPQEFAEPKPDQLDTLASRGAEESRPILADWIKTIKTRLEAGDGDLSDFADELDTLYPELSSASFAAIMGDIMCVARLAGGDDGL